MRAYLRNLLGSAARCWPNHCCGTAVVQFFCSLFVNLLCRKPEIESLGFTCNWLVLVGRLAWTSVTCTSFRVADKFTTAKRKAGTLYQILRDTQLSFGCCVGLAQLKETPAHRTAASLWLRSNLRRCTSEPTPHLYAPPAMFIEVTSATLRAHPKQALATSRQQGRGVLEPLYTTTSASSSWSRTKNICSACLLAFATAKSALYSVGSPRPPKNVGSSGQQMSWHRVESAFFLRNGEGKRRRGLPLTRACSSWKWNPSAAAPGAVEGRAWVP